MTSSCQTQTVAMTARCKKSIQRSIKGHFQDILAKGVKFQDTFEISGQLGLRPLPLVLL